MSAGHCCAAGATKAICGGNERPGVKLAESIATFTNNAGSNDFCLLHLDRPVTSVPIYQVATPDDVEAREDAIIVGYGVANSGTPQLGAGTQREGLVQITRVGGFLPPGIDIFVTGRTGMPYQNACNGDSGGPIFIPGQDGLVVGGVTSRWSLLPRQQRRDLHLRRAADQPGEHHGGDTRVARGAVRSSAGALPGHRVLLRYGV